MPRYTVHVEQSRFFTMEVEASNKARAMSIAQETFGQEPAGEPYDESVSVLYADSTPEDDYAAAKEAFDKAAMRLAIAKAVLNQET